MFAHLKVPSKPRILYGLPCECCGSYYESAIEVCPVCCHPARSSFAQLGREAELRVSCVDSQQQR